ncbi:hypothetical protein AAG906_020512 [Vitis piasezkii]
MLRWAIELSEYEIKYHSRPALKGQVMADYIVELSQNYPPNILFEEKWLVLHLNGASRVSAIFWGSYLKCLSDPEAQYVLSELQEDVCGNHAGGRTLAHCTHT